MVFFSSLIFGNLLSLKRQRSSKAALSLTLSLRSMKRTQIKSKLLCLALFLVPSRPQMGKFLSLTWTLERKFLPRWSVVKFPLSSIGLTYYMQNSDGQMIQITLSSIPLVIRQPYNIGGCWPIWFGSCWCFQKSRKHGSEAREIVDALSEVLLKQSRNPNHTNNTPKVHSPPRNWRRCSNFLHAEPRFGRTKSHCWQKYHIQGVLGKEKYLEWWIS